MRKPTAVEGLVIRYDFLWGNEYQRGRTEGQKDRPCAIVIAAPDQNGTVERVIVAPITHAKPLEGVQAIEIPQKVKRHLGLDEERSWIVIDNLNRVRWDDPGIVPVSRSKWEYGALPQALVTQVQEQVRNQAKARKVTLLDREKIENRRVRDEDRGR